MRYEVSFAEVAARPTAVVAAATTWQQFPALWGGLLDEVWACLRAGGVERGCRNVMLYRDDVPHVEIGVELAGPLALSGRVVASSLPAGRVATTVHSGSYAGLAQAHEAVVEACAARGTPLTRTRWEVYGPHHEDPARVWTEVSWLLA
jgi:effector-binding domain-containing protein